MIVFHAGKHELRDESVPDVGKLKRDIRLGQNPLVKVTN